MDFAEYAAGLDPSEIIGLWEAAARRTESEELACGFSDEVRIARVAAENGTVISEFLGIEALARYIAEQMHASGHGEDCADGAYAGIMLLATMIREHDAQTALAQQFKIE